MEHNGNSTFCYCFYNIISFQICNALWHSFFEKDYILVSSYHNVEWQFIRKTELRLGFFCYFQAVCRSYRGSLLKMGIGLSFFRFVCSDSIELKFHSSSFYIYISGRMVSSNSSIFDTFLTH